MGRSGLRISPVGFGFHCVHKVRKLDCILNEKWCHIVADEIPVSGFRIEFNRKSANVARRVLRALGSGDGRKTDEQRAAIPFLLEKLSLRQLGDRFCYLKYAMRSGAARVDDTFGNAFMVKMEYFFAKHEIFEQAGTARAGFETILVVGNAMPEIVGQMGNAITMICIRLYLLMSFTAGVPLLFCMVDATAAGLDCMECIFESRAA